MKHHDYALEVAKARRLTILLMLYFAPGFRLPRLLLQDQVNKTGYATGSDLLATEIAWLAEQGFVERLDEEVTQLTVRGQDIALGHSFNDGVRRPDPGTV